MKFPESISLTITNACNLRCKMCGQWSETGYMHEKKENQKLQLELRDWERLIDEIAENNITSVLLRGGEPFLYPEIMELIEYINRKEMFVSIDTNGTMLGGCAEEIIRLGNIHLTFSVDGPEEIHDRVRGITGAYKKTRDNIILLNELAKGSTNKISKSITFTISPYSYKGLGKIPDIARSMGIDTVTIVPYYYIPGYMGREYENELRQLGCTAYSWCGFNHDESVIDIGVFKEQLKEFYEALDGIYSFPYFPLTEEEYMEWFTCPHTLVGKTSCTNVERLMDIQPNGDVNFCVDFPDYIIGNVKESNIETIWNSDSAERFREYRRNNLLSVCYRCGAKYMSEINV